MNKSAAASQVTLRDIATNLNVSHSTVSRALQNASSISLERRKEIQAVAQRMGYRPNAMATVLGHQRHANHKHTINSEIAWINYWPDSKKLRSFKEFDLYWKGANRRAEEGGYRLEEFVCNNQISPARLEQILSARNIHGVLIPPHGGFQPPAGWDKIDWEKFSIVRFGYNVPTPQTHLVASNPLTTGMLALENMWRLGYERIGFVGKSDKNIYYKAGFLLKEALKTHNPIPMYNFVEPFRTRAQLSAFSTWISKNQLDAILSDLTETHSLLTELGYRIPADIGLATTSILDGEATAGIDQNPLEIGMAAMETLLSLLNHNQHGIPKVVREIVITGSWVDGGTLPPRAHRPPDSVISPEKKRRSRAVAAKPKLSPIKNTAKA